MNRPTQKQTKHTQRVCSSRQFRKIYSEGIRFNTPFFTAFTLPNDLGSKRFGITVTRRIGNAVIRNRCKRRMRAVFQEWGQPWRQQQPQTENALGLDLIINVKSELLKAEYSALVEAFARTLERAETFWRKRLANEPVENVEREAP